MDKSVFEKRLKEINDAILMKQSELQQLIGHFNEVKYMLETQFKEECESFLSGTIPGEKEVS